MKKILFLTGTRADFGKLGPLMSSLQRRSEIDFKIFVTGMHMLSKFGLTHIEVEREYSDDTFLYKNQAEDGTDSLDIILSKTIKGLNDYVSSYQPDLIILHGDRVEALAAACVGSMNNILTAHVEGGEVSGTIDELMRHAISKLSHIHFVANDDAKKRLIQLGEEHKNIFIIGSPDIDLMVSDRLPSLGTVKEHYEINFNEYLIFCYHPVTTELDQLDLKVKQIYRSISKSNENFIVIETNNDPGSDLISKTLEPLRDKQNFQFFPSLRHDYFLTLLKNAKCIIGNSSTCVREAPIFATPSINLGSRQNGRYSYISILDTIETESDISNSLKLINHLPKMKPSMYFGDGKSVEKFTKILDSKNFWNTNLQKTFVDI